MASLRSLAIVWGFVLAIPLVLSATADKNCLSLFASSEAALNGIDDVVTVDIDVGEKTPENQVIYTLTWNADCVTAPQITDGNFNTYFTVNDTTDCTWEISVNTNLIGVPDYPNPQGTIETQVVFEGFTIIPQENCKVTLIHKILDANTQKPEPDKTKYNLDIKEDFQPSYVINSITTPVHDADGTSPNNQFTATTDGNCPLEATESTYTSGLNAVPVAYQLKETLDYETVQQMECIVTFQDLGSPPSTKTATITVNVQDVPDEPPEFLEDFYFTEVASVVASNNPLPMNPSNISAFDGDTTIDAPITYSMIDVQTDVDGTTYFAINSKTGEVTLVKDLDEAFLLNERVLFFLKASDSTQIATALLDVTLPPLPTTTASTTPATTCEPCTCPTYTTETVTECPTEGTCPPCPSDTTTEFTCPVVTCPTTPTEGTCPPCPTDTTTEFTCPVVTCPTTPTEGTCPPCPTHTTTEFTCPVVTCPTTPTEGTCPPCPTHTTTEFTCPVVTCPTTPGECTCDPCPTETTTEFTCPVVTCPTTPGECTCDPCPTDTTTECTCPVVTCPTTPGTEFSTITWGPDQPNLTFEQSSYAGSIYTETVKVYQVKVEDIGYEVIYEWSEDSPYFNIDSSTGWITVKKDSAPPEGLYQLEAVATIKVAPTEQATAKVNIHVLPITSETLIIENSLMRHQTMEGEGEEDLGIIKLSQPAKNVCIIGAQPLPMHERFSLEKQDDKNWKLRKTGALDYEAMHEITLVIEAFYEDVSCTEITVNDQIPSELTRSQALAIISVNNQNDEKPVFSIENLVAAYPTNEGLRKAMGPVVSVQAEDGDGTEVKYSVTGPDADQFTVNEETGEVYIVEGLDSYEEYNFGVTASDGDNDAQLNVKVLPLDMKHVFTLLLGNTTFSDVDAELTQLSEDVGVQISKLYVSPTQLTARQRRRHKREAEVSLEVHVYSIEEGSLMSRDDLNSALDGHSLQAEEFVDAVMFEGTNNTNDVGMTVAVAILGSLLGLVLIAGIGFVIYKKKKNRGAPKEPRLPSPINTLGNAYQNQSYEKEGHVTQGSLGHKTNGSLNGFTSVQVHSTQDRNSPPMHRSPLASPSDSILLKSMESQQQQGGLRRTNPSAPEYYGSSTPAPPPSFTRTTTSPEPSSSSSSYPIYAEIKKPKDPKPKSSAAISSSSRPEKNASSMDKKTAVSNAGYEEVGSSKFSSLKDSPPPRRSKKTDDDDDEDVKEGVAYPGGKNAKFKDEPDAQDERKSVAFKVMVDTKEIEAENKGPAQKKAEVEKLMEANRKKLQEKGNDEDEEESEKL